MRFVSVFATLLLVLIPLALVAQNGDTEIVAREEFRVLLTPAKEVPPLPDVTSSAEAVVEIVMQRTGEPVVCNEDGVDENDEPCDPDEVVDLPDGELIDAVVGFRVNYSLAATETITAMHIHRGSLSESGPVVINSGFGAPVTAGPGEGSFFRSISTSDPAQLAVVEEILANPEGFYLNVHTQSHPPGIFRGQLREAAPPLPGVDENSQKLDLLIQKVDALEVLIRTLAGGLGVTFPK